MSQTELDLITPEWSGYAVHYQPPSYASTGGTTTKTSIRQAKVTRAYVAVVLLDLPPSGAGDTARLPFLSGNFAQVDDQRGLWLGKQCKKAAIHQNRPRPVAAGRIGAGLSPAQAGIDGSPHDWFEGRAPRCTLIAFIDDASSWAINFAFFAHRDYTGLHGDPRPAT